MYFTRYLPTELLIGVASENRATEVGMRKTLRQIREAPTFTGKRP